MTDRQRETVAWLLWCADQGYLLAESRAGMTNWFLEDPATLHVDDRDSREGWLSLADAVLEAMEVEKIIYDEIEYAGHKVFVSEGPSIQMVNDERPLVRMTLPLTVDDAREIAQSLNDMADASHG